MVFFSGALVKQSTPSEQFCCYQPCTGRWVSVINCANPPDSPSHANAPLPSRPTSSVPSTGSVDCILMQEMKETPSPRNKGNSSLHLVEHLKDVKSSNSLTPVAYQMRHVGRSFQCVPLERLQRINQSAALSVSTWNKDSKHLCFYLVQFLLVLWRDDGQPGVGFWKAPGKLQGSGVSHPWQTHWSVQWSCVQQCPLLGSKENEANEVPGKAVPVLVLWG